MRDLEDPTQFGNANRSQVEIRQATEDDASAILALHQESINDQDLPHDRKPWGWMSQLTSSIFPAHTLAPSTTDFGWRSHHNGNRDFSATRTCHRNGRRGGDEDRRRRDAPASSDTKLPPPRHCRTFAAGGFGPLPGSRILEGPVGRPA